MSKRGGWIGIGITFGVGCLMGLTGYADPPPAAAESSSMPRELTEAELATLERAEDILISRCMKQRGFTFVPTRKPAGGDRTFRYVIDDVGWAREHGFGSEERRRMAKALKNDPNQQYFGRLAPEQQRAALAALNGDRPEGLSAQVPLVGVVTASDQSCRADAQRRLYGDLPTWFRVDVVVSNLTALYVPKVEKDARFTQAVADWGRCMKRAGHPYESPKELRAALDRPREVLDHAHEVRLAVAEARCSRSTALAATARELDRYYGDQARDQYRSEIATKRRLQLAALPQARKITAAGF